jgi:mono/diheme cytochrome c family protein/plastocyanin
MNTSKQINIMVALVFISVLATGAYTMWDPTRAADEREAELGRVVERGAFLFSQNCAVCHGNKGEGGAASNRLRVAPPLNRADLQGREALNGPVSEQDKKLQFKFIVNTITCGRIGKAMPTWGQAQGGTLNDEQIRQLATMITEGTEWEAAEEFAINGDHEHHYTGYASAGVKLTQPMDQSSTTAFLTSVDLVGKGLRLEIDNDPSDDNAGELMLITENPNKEQKSVTVERGLGSTSPAAHPADSAVWLPPVPPDPAPVTQPACGQNLPAAVPTASGPVTPSATLSIISSGTAFSATTLLGIAGQPLTLTHDNQDAGIAHNIHFYKGEDKSGEDVAQTDIEAGPVTQTLNFGPLDAGDYFFQCDVHPGQMEGTLTTVAAGAEPAAATTPAADAAPTTTP